ncbi:DUF732 domain-containing protein [Mycolicibacterium sp. A43C]
MTTFKATARVRRPSSGVRATSFKALLIGAATVLSVVGLAATAHADTADQNNQFLEMLKSRGWSIINANVLTLQGHMVCNEGLGHGVSAREISAQLMSYGYSALDSSSLISSAVSAFCPDRRGAITDIEHEAPSREIGDQGDLFVQNLKLNQHISIDKGAAADMARTACDAPLQGVGLYNAQQAMQQRHPEYDLNIVATVMAQGVLMYCPDRLG